MMFRALLAFLAALASPSALVALDLTLPSSAELTVGEDLGLDSYALPTAAFDGSAVPSRRFEGFVQRQAWRVSGAGITPLQVLRPLRAELEKTGYTIIFDCRDDACGGFDYRFGTEGITAPDMIVDLDNFYVVSALKGEDASPSAAVNLLVSRSRDAVYVQIVSVSVDQTVTISIDKGAAITGTSSTNTGAQAQTKGATTNAVPVDIAKRLEINGHVILKDLVFETGSAELGDGDFDSLDRIAAYLSGNPTRRIALVGHTDAVGALAGNVALSKRRAASVRDRLINAHDVAAAQLEADGVGFLAPVATNLSRDGRQANRRVEAVLISTE